MCTSCGQLHSLGIPDESHAALVYGARGSLRVTVWLSLATVLSAGPVRSPCSLHLGHPSRPCSGPSSLRRDRALPEGIRQLWSSPPDPIATQAATYCPYHARCGWLDGDELFLASSEDGRRVWRSTSRRRWFSVLNIALSWNPVVGSSVDVVGRLPALGLASGVARVSEDRRDGGDHPVVAAAMRVPA